ncbi:MAG TPA: tetratricopeptide repeat protein, partial [Candidatus Limnocylindria bacterium]|nr:tetratricopeptide repeat protein [Candidatus Limnocylindria bacterium]
QSHFSVRFAPRRLLKWKSSLGDRKPVVEEEGGLTLWKWERYAFQPRRPESNIPRWHVAHSWIQVSECADWQTVADACAVGFVEDSSPLLDELVAQFRSGATDRLQSISRAIDFVQVECRYLSIDLGQGGHVPSSPGTVARRRYGDCKDLALLLSCLLKRLEVPAVPVLVHSWLQKSVADMLPDPARFNHVVVEFTLEGERRWVDPTIRNQGGGALNRFVPDYGVGLPMSAGATGLIDQPRTAQELNRYELRESILLDTTGQPSYFRVIIKASGDPADSFRAQLAVRGQEAFAQDRLQGHANRFGYAKRVGALQYRDDRETNEFLLVEVFEINGFLQNAQPGFCTFNHVTAGFSGTFLPLPEAESRLAPFALTYPCNITYHIDVESARLRTGRTSPRERIESPYFNFSRTTHCNLGYWQASLNLTTLADCVPADRVAEHRKLVEGVWRLAACTLNVPLGHQRGRLPVGFGQLPPSAGNTSGRSVRNPSTRPATLLKPSASASESPRQTDFPQLAEGAVAPGRTRVNAGTETPESERAESPTVSRTLSPRQEVERRGRRRRNRGRFFWVTAASGGIAVMVALWGAFTLFSGPSGGAPRGAQESDTEAARRFRKAAFNGDAKAQDSLGIALMTGRGDGPDPVEAALWFRKAAEQGLPDAEFNLGVAYYEGRGLAKDASEAAKWHRRAAEHGFAKAQHNLSVLYMNGLGVERDEAEALRWCRQAAEQGLAQAQCDLGVALIKGRGTAVDEVAAVKWLRKAADQGYPPAQYNLGMAYGEGRGVPKDPSEGYAWIKLASRLESKALPVLGNLEREFPPAIISAGKQRAADLQQQLDARKRNGP